MVLIRSVDSQQEILITQKKKVQQFLLHPLVFADFASNATCYIAAVYQTTFNLTCGDGKI